jgi:DNA-binding phage protein
MSMNTKQAFANQIRAAAKRYGTPYALARDSGVNSAVVGRFMKGERDVTLTTAEKLCGALGLELRPTRQPKRGR